MWDDIDLEALGVDTLKPYLTREENTPEAIKTTFGVPLLEDPTREPCPKYHWCFRLNLHISSNIESRKPIYKFKKDKRGKTLNYEREKKSVKVWISAEGTNGTSGSSLWQEGQFPEQN